MQHANLRVSLQRDGSGCLPPQHAAPSRMATDELSHVSVKYKPRELTFGWVSSPWLMSAFLRTESGRHAESPLSVSRQHCLPRRRGGEDQWRDADRQLARSEHKPANTGIWLASFQFLGSSKLCFVVYYPSAPISDLPTGGQCISGAPLLQPHVFTRGETRQTCESTAANPLSRCPVTS